MTSPDPTTCSTCGGDGLYKTVHSDETGSMTPASPCPACQCTGTNPREAGLGSLPESPQTEAVTAGRLIGSGKSRPDTLPTDSLEQELHYLICACEERGGCENPEYQEIVGPGVLALIRRREGTCPECEHCKRKLKSDAV